MRLIRLVTIALMISGLTAPHARAADDKAGVFDYWVLALSWSPTWCALEGDARGAEQCSRPLGWSLHGLWPQYTRGWPSYCTTPHAPPRRAMTAEMVDIMGSSGLAWHQWRKHGVCSGLDAAQYLALSRQAYDSVVRPEVFRKIPDPVRLPASVVEEAFLKANPGLSADSLTITCRQGRIHEARVCLARNTLVPVPCGRDVIRDCAATDALFDPVR